MLLEALPYVKGKNVLDLGSGSLNDAHYLAENGFVVTAVDSNPKILEHVQADKLISICITPFSGFCFEDNSYDLVNAQYALPFESPEQFEATFCKVVKSLKTGGIFAGQLFGIEDGWATNSKMTFHTQKQIETFTSLFSKVHVLREEKKIGPTVLGTDKMWHVYHIIAEK